jgi:hypothetical protein
VVSFLKKGSSKGHVQRLVFEIVSLLSKMKCQIEPRHLLRSDERMVKADAASKMLDSDDWSIDATNFRLLEAEFGLEVDLFASSTNKRLSLFLVNFTVRERKV